MNYCINTEIKWGGLHFQHWEGFPSLLYFFLCNLPTQHPYITGSQIITFLFTGFLTHHLLHESLGGRGSTIYLLLSGRADPGQILVMN